MKIKGHVTEVMDHGDNMKVAGQGRAVGGAEWRPWLSIAINMPITKRNRKAFHIGRTFTVEVTPD